ncbi:MAG: FtsW/RodA/SpoVE family cell cycle protein [Deltaproteobacteria bacterium]|nr:FtsW/RodA/SpoVE family cell cycle protein [Deltaproteobacteria bacterium]
MASVIRGIDRPLLFTVLAILGLGLYNLASASRPMGVSLHVSQGVYAAAGLLVMALIASFHYRLLEGLAIPIFVTVLVLLLATDLFGKIVNGSRRWLVVGPVNVQTSDLAKVAVILVLARILHLERWEGGLTLRQIFRPFNLSRPVLLIAVVLVASVLGDAVRPPKLELLVNNRHRAVGKLGETTPTLRIGSRKKGTDVQLPMGGVAGQHAEVLRVEDGEYRVRDLGSEAGTYVNGQRVVGELPLHHGDLIRFGLNPRAELRFSASIAKVRPFLPYLAILAALWLGLALVQIFSTRTFGWPELIAPIDVVIVPCVLVLAQPDLGTTMVTVLVAFTMFLYVGLRPVSLALLFASGLVFAIIAWLGILKPYQKERVMTFLNPTSDLAGAGYHQHQSMIAIGSGGWFGKGHGQGTQTQLSFLPEQQTDFIFSVWAEEQGFVGCLILVALYAALIIVALRITLRARDRFGALLACGATALLFWHTAINMLMVLRLAPVVGVPLPLFSNGGSFLVTVLMAIGLLMSVSVRRQMF